MEKEKVKPIWSENLKDFAISWRYLSYDNFIDFILHCFQSRAAKNRKP